MFSFQKRNKYTGFLHVAWYFEVQTDSTKNKQTKLGIPSSRSPQLAAVFVSISALPQLQFRTPWYPDTMDEEDDDFYDPADVVPPSQMPNDVQNPPSQPQEADDAEEEEVEVEDDEVRLRHSERPWERSG